MVTVCIRGQEGTAWKGVKRGWLNTEGRKQFPPPIRKIDKRTTIYSNIVVERCHTVMLKGFYKVSVLPSLPLFTFEPSPRVPRDP